MADGDFLAVAAPVAGVAHTAGAAGGDAERDGFEAHAIFPEADIELVVGHDGERGVEAVVFEEERAAVERGLVMDEIAREGIDVGAELVDAAVVEGGLAGGDAGLGFFHPVDGFAQDHVADEAVVGAEEENPFAGGAGDTLVHGVVNAGVGLGDEDGEAGALRLEPLARAVGGGTVDDDDLGGDMELLPDAGERGGETGAGVFADENDAEGRRGGHCVRGSITQRRRVSMPELPLLSIVIVAYKSRDEIGACLQSIPRKLRRANGARGGTVEVVVVDNSPTERDGVGEVVRRAAPWVTCVAAEANLGFGRANNLGFARTRGEFVLFLNPDTVVNAAALEHCLARLEEDVEIGLISPKLVTADGSMDLACRRSIPTLWDGFCRASGLAAKWPRNTWVAGYNLTFLPEGESYDVGAINGAFMLGARWLFAEEVAEDGAVFDERFFMYGDDLDLCIRVNEAGFRVVYDGSVQITHLKGVSVAKDFDVMSRAIFDANREVYLKHFVPRGEAAVGVVGAMRAGFARTKYRVAFGLWKAVALARAKLRGHRRVRPV